MGTVLVEELDVPWDCEESCVCEERPWDCKKPPWDCELVLLPWDCEEALPWDC